MGYGIPLSDHPDRSKPPEDHRARAETSTINEKTIADFTRIVEQTGILRQPGGVKAHARTHPPPPS